MKKLVLLTVAAIVTACADQCTSVVDGTETSVACDSGDDVSSTDVGAAVQTEVEAGN